MDDDADEATDGLVSLLPAPIEPDLDPEDVSGLFPSVLRTRPALVAGLSGRVLDLGAGDAELVTHADANADDPTIHLLEPKRFLVEWGRETVADSTVDAHQLRGRGEALPYPDDTFDAVVTKEVLCAVDDPAAVLSEIDRVLRPDGQYRYVEHVHSDGVEGWVETAVAPLWERAISWCRVDRANDAAIADSDLEVREQYRYTDVGTLPPWTYVAGVAVPG